VINHRNPEMAFEEVQNLRVLLQQGDHERKRGAHDSAIFYLDRAVKVIKTFFHL